MTMKITAKVALELVSHEAIVREAYRDSKKVWTWSVGITNSSGHKVYPRYKDNPQSIKRCLEVYIWLLENKYAPAVRSVFADHPLSEEQFAGALSFHYNTGGIRIATWAKKWKAGDITSARKTFMNWKKPPNIIGRRRKERDLFFDGKWSNNGKATVWPVKKPSYRPDWSNPKTVDVSEILDDLLGQ